LGLPNYTFGGIGDPWGSKYSPVTLANFKQ
jgi:hypothetical protein